MGSDNITRAEAAHRSALLATDSYRVSLDLTGRGADGTPLGEPERTFGSTSVISFTATSAGDTWIDLIADRIDAATLDGAPLDTSGYDGNRLPLTVTAGEHELVVSALCRYSRTGEGLHRFVDPADDRVYLYTQFEVPDARRVYACFEQPDLKATFTFHVLAPATWTVISNSTSVDPQPAGAGVGRWEFATTTRLSTYVTAIIAGEYAKVDGQITSRAGTIPASIVCRHSLTPHLDADRIWRTTQRGFDVYERTFDVPYPFDSYDQAFVPEYNAGAMENAGCITFRDDLIFRSRATEAQYQVRDNTILHELAHMWFGDLVTMSWWDDLWLNESFAEWASHFAQGVIDTENGLSPERIWADFCISRKGWAYRQDQLPSTHPVAADMVDLDAVGQNFDGITYAKGCSVLRQLVAFVGLEPFAAGVTQYFRKHAFGNTRLDDLFAELTATSGRDLSGWAGEWLETTGVNTLRAEFDVDASGAYTTFAVVQTAAADHPTLRTHRLGIGLYDLRDGALTRTERIEVDITGARTELPQLVGRRRPDLLVLNDGDLTFAKIRLDPDSLATLIEHVHRLDSELTRALCWAAAWDMCRDAELRAGDYVDLVLRGVGAESEISVVSAVLAQATTAAQSYTAPAHRAEVLARWESGVLGLLAAAEPGSDHQLGYARALCAAAVTPVGIDTLEGWRSGRALPEGLTLDADLRWQVVGALAREGRLGEREIADELSRDATITGREAAAAARAARPDAAAKQAAWNAAVEDPHTPNETQRKICAAFMQDRQDEVLAPYVERYFALCEAISADRDGWGERSLQGKGVATNLLFPFPLADRALIERIDTWSRSAGLNDQVRRTIAERRSAAVRALACQEFDATA